MDSTGLPGAAQCCGLKGGDGNRVCLASTKTLGTAGALAVAEGARLLPWHLLWTLVEENRVSAHLTPILLFLPPILLD